MISSQTAHRIAGLTFQSVCMAICISYWCSQATDAGAGVLVFMHGFLFIQSPTISHTCDMYHIFIGER
ncbi:hypothetical protein [Lysinibacillus sphaericus]|uniref:hypothetical protein n=2 Tax=Lysinibacillus sphaericus TaxID=1421 RepID=UPI000A92FC93|nr:hypothetical protein [Lysinibacillus sphaericus]QPA53985.1 hypothetical protein INQ53_19850 [Lysinibacillus sphaericus]QPA58306.1 hypothetical protein INQ55_19905 [Lysinibacillus sphaericus]QTB13175.1 hypothetical protein J2B92_20805 [Lysinibacillus sphaericus]